MKLQKVRELTDDLYSGHMKGAGCCLHILTDDCNIEDSSVDFCIKWAEEAISKGRDSYGNTHEDCLALAKLYRELTVRERAIVLNMGWCPKCEDYSCCGICHECNGPLDPLNEDEEAGG